MTSAKWKNFEPYVTQLRVPGLDGRFLVATPHARIWYDRIKPDAQLEQGWIVQNIPLQNQMIVDGGAHHGKYSVLFALASKNSCNLVSIDPYPMNCLLTEINLLLNETTARIEQCAITDKSGRVHFTNESNGRITARGGIVVKSRTLHEIEPNAEVVKLDIERAEYKVIPASIDKLCKVHTWIVEIHPDARPHPDTIIKLFLDRDYEVLWVNREKSRVEPYALETEWKTHSTIFARK